MLGDIATHPDQLDAESGEIHFRQALALAEELGMWRSGLREKGWIEGKNLLVEYRYAQSQDRMPALAAELIALTRDLVIASGPQAAVALKSATATIPIVLAVHA